MGTGDLTDHPIPGVMIPSTMIITLPIHTTARTTHGVTARIPIIIITVAITVTDTPVTIPGTPATDTPHITMMADMWKISPAEADTAPCQEDHTPTLISGPSQAMHLQVT